MIEPNDVRDHGHRCPLGSHASAHALLRSYAVPALMQYDPARCAVDGPIDDNTDAHVIPFGHAQ